MKLYARLLALPLILLSAAWLSACQTTDSGEGAALSAAEAFGPLAAGQSGRYAALAADAAGDTRFHALILMTRYHAGTGNFEQAASALGQLAALAVTQLQTQELHLIRADVASLQGDSQRAAQHLGQVHVPLLPAQAAAFHYNLSTRVYEELLNKNPASEVYYAQAMAAYMQLIPLLGTESAPAAARRALRLAQTRTAEQLSAAMAGSQDVMERGFYQYAIIDRTVNRAVRQRLLEDFRSQYPGHILAALPTAQTAPAGQAETEAAAEPPAPVISRGDKIAVLLPQSGRFRDIVGIPAKLGILAAIQDLKARLEVTFYDTNKHSIQDIVTQVAGDGTRLILGPILKPEVEALISSSSTLPAIVFNTTGQAMPAGMYYFDLGPNFEGMAAASRMAADGHGRVVVTQGPSVRQRRVYEGFLSQAGRVGLTVTACEYKDIKTVRADLGSCSLGGVDAVYINGTAIEANAVRPVLALGEGQPVYLTASSYAGVNHSGLEMSMRGALLGDMPWLLSESSMKEAFMRHIPKADAQAQRIFAAGYDSVSVAFNLPRLTPGSGNTLHGLSGDISLHGSLIWNEPLWVRLGERR